MSSERMQNQIPYHFSVRAFFLWVKMGIPPPVNRCPCQNAQKPLYFFGNCGAGFSLTLLGKSGKVNEVNAMMKTSKRYHPSIRELPVGARQRKDGAEYISEWLR